MYTFKQKKIIKSYKLRLQDKLKTVTEETENVTEFLNNYVEEFRNRVQHILEIKDEKCLSSYRKLIRDLENYSEKLFILQASFEEEDGDESDSSEDEKSVAKSQTQSKIFSSLPSESEKFSQISSYPESPIDKQHQGNADLQRCTENVDLQTCAENIDLQRHSKNVNLDIYPEENFSLQICPRKSLDIQKDIKENINSRRSLEVFEKYDCHDEDGGNITEDDFYSLHSDNNVLNKNNCTLSSQLHTYHNGNISGNEYASNVSFSQSSCYRSISSNISESLPFYKENKTNQSIETHNVEINNECSLESLNTNLVIQSPNFEISSHFSGSLSHIIDPGNFWIQIENSHGYKYSFPRSEYSHRIGLSSIKKGNYCLAPFKSTSFYYRAQSLSDGKYEKELVTVLFIDHGSIQEIAVHDLHYLPKSAYEVSAQAIHCYLYGILPTMDSWSFKSIERFKEFQNFSCIDVIVKSKDSLYGVQLVGKLSADLEEDFSVDISQALCLDGLALSLNESQLHDCKQNYEPQLSEPVCNKIDSSLEVSRSYDINAISNDSGVSVNSASKYSQISNESNRNFHKVYDCASKITAEHDKDALDLKHDIKMKDPILFESYDALDNFQNSSEVLKSTSTAFSSCCLSCRNKNFCMHLKISSPSLLFVEKDMVIVMLSHIVNPHEFYVNMAMENIDILDELREQMTKTYESKSNLHKMKINDLTENMFCAGRFSADEYWYRVKIIRCNSEDKEKDQVLGQYIDYGNTAVIHCADLRPLATEFSKHPCFAVKCTLAGVKPVQNARFGSHSSYWEDDAINCFKKLTSFERCLTAQICNELCSNQNETYPVLLWDTKDSQDLLINAALAEQKMATFDNHLLNSILTNQKEVEKSLIDLDSWDPMLEEYRDADNNYTVDDENIELMTTGYQAKDESYVCKYYALQGICPRGSNCRLKHLPLLESGITHDQEEVYCIDTVPIISETVNNILVQVSAIITPTHFYVVLPFGCKTVDDIDNLVYQGSSYDKIFNSEAKALFYALDKHYSATPFMENTTIALSCGTIVVAKRKWDEKWHRGRIIDVIGIDKPSKVFFVDSGDHEWVPRKFIRTILPQFLHTPFQAVQCSLHGIEPVGFEKELSWSSEALNYFKDIVAGEILLAEVVNRLGKVYHVSLKKTSQNDHADVAQLLVSGGFAQYHKISRSNRNQTLYVPG